MPVWALRATMPMDEYAGWMAYARLKLWRQTDAAKEQKIILEW